MDAAAGRLNHRSRTLTRSLRCGMFVRSMNELTTLDIPTVRNGTSLRRRNLRTVLEVIRDLSAVSQADIARETGLRPSTVSYLVRELRLNNLLTVVGRGSVGACGGKPAVMLGPDPDTASFVGLLVTGERVSSDIMDFTGRMAGSPVTTPVHGGAVAGGVLSHLHSRFWHHRRTSDRGTSIRNRSDPSSRSPAAIGVAVASIVDETAAVAPSADFPYRVEDLAAIIRAAVRESPPVAVENDANCIAHFAERLDPRPHASTLALLFADRPRSIGAGLCIGGRIHRGFHGSAGELLETGVSGGARLEWEDAMVSTAVRFVDPEVVVLAVARTRRAAFAAEHPRLQRELARRSALSVDAETSAIAGAAQLAYESAVPILIARGPEEELH